jgi:RNA polymerase sigma-70 factor (ECF subfamily)
LIGASTAALTRDLVKATLGRIVNQGQALKALGDEDLVRLCLEDDHRAFTVLVDRYKHKIHWLVRRMLGSAEVEDITQEVFLRAYQAMPRFEGRSSFRTWLYKIAHNLCLTEIAKRGRRGEHLSLDEEGEEKVHWMLPDNRQGLMDEIERRDFSENVWALVGRLPENYRTALTLFYIEQARYEEIAEIMGIPMGTVKTYIHRARLRMRDLVLAESDLAGLAGEDRKAAAENPEAADENPTSGGG